MVDLAFASGSPVIEVIAIGLGRDCAETAVSDSGCASLAADPAAASDFDSGCDSLRAGAAAASDPAASSLYS